MGSLQMAKLIYGGQNLIYGTCVQFTDGKIKVRRHLLKFI